MTEPQTSAAVPPGGSPPSQGVSPTPGSAVSDFTPAQLQEMAGWLVADGKLTKEQAAEALRPGDQDEPPAVAGDDGLPPISDQAARYEMPQIRDETGQYSREAMVFDRQARTWLEAAGFDREGGSYVAAEINRTVEHYESLPEPGRKLFEIEQRVMLEKLWGADYEANRAMTCEFVDALEAKHPGILETLSKSGAGKSAALMTKLYFRAREARDGGATTEGR